jgi:hypothetical protein
MADNPDSVHATVTHSGDGVVTVGVGVDQSQGGQSVPSGGGSGVSCTYTPLDAKDAALIAGPPGPPPGEWVMPTCIRDGYINPLPPMWVSTAPRASQAAPITVARDALAQLDLPPGAIRMAPDTGHDQLVGARTWLWVDPSTWHSFSATAAVGAVAATATAQPTKVVWSMGDGESVTCTGPGSPYDSSRPDSAQSTDCSYTWPSSSARQPGNAFTVTATVYWEVSWTARGAPGGGNLGTIASPPSRVAVRVAEAQALNQGG